MGFLLRVALVVGAIYYLSPVRDEAGPAAARAFLGRQAEAAGAAALEFCLKNPSRCQAVAGTVAEPAQPAAGRTQPEARPASRSQ